MNPNLKSYILHGQQDLPGWLEMIDCALFVAVDEAQQREGITGDLLEIGVYQGRSAILLGYLKRPTEQFYVCDLFGAPSHVEETRMEQDVEYRDLTRESFERHYLRFHDSLPRVLAVASSSLRGLLPEHSFRLIHIDGSHAYEDVQQDISLARRLLAPRGVVVFDDIRTPHTPGVSAAVWGAVATDDLVPAIITSKLYSTWSEPVALDLSPIGAELGLRVSNHVSMIGKQPLVRWVAEKTPGPPPNPATRWIPPALLPACRSLFHRAEAISKALQRRSDQASARPVDQ